MQRHIRPQGKGTTEQRTYTNYINQGIIIKIIRTKKKSKKTDSETDWPRMAKVPGQKTKILPTALT